MAGGGAIIHRWHAPTGAQSSSFQAEKTALLAAISWLEEHENWRKALLICDCKSLVDAVGNSLAPDEFIRLVQAAVARLNVERCLEVLWVPGHCGLPGNELADEEAKLGSAEDQPPVQLDNATRRAIIRRACSSTFVSTPLHTATYPIVPAHREDTQLSKRDMTHLRRFRSGHHPALRRWQQLINRSEEATCRICNDEDETYDHLWLRCPAFDADRMRLNLGVSIDELTRFPLRAQALLWIILRRLR